MVYFIVNCGVCRGCESRFSGFRRSAPASIKGSFTQLRCCMARFNIVGGPDRSSLEHGLFARRFDRPYPLEFTLEQGSQKQTVTLHVASVAIEDGSGNSWIISCQSADFKVYYEGCYSTRIREGYLVEVDAEKTREQTIRDRLEGAMAYDHTVRVTFRKDRDVPFRGHTVDFFNVRPCSHHSLSRFCASPILWPEDESTFQAETVGLFIDSVESVELSPIR